MIISLKPQILSRFFLLLSVYCIPINFDYYSLRISDFTLLVSLCFFYSYVKFPKYFVFIVIYFFLSPLLAFFINIIINYELTIYIEKFIFIYKYILLFSVIFLCKSHLQNSHEFEFKLLFSLYVIFIFLSLWVFIYQYLVLNGYIIGVLRPSFPFSRDYWYSDAHLYSSLLAIFLLSYIFYIGRTLNHNNFVFILTCLLSFSAIVFTGSRGGLLIFSLFLSIFIMIRFIFSKKSNFKNFVFLFFTIFMFLFLFLSKIEFNESISVLLERTFNFDFSNDASSSARIDNLKVAINDFSSGYYIIGVGPFLATLKWYDGIFSIILSHYGIVGFLFFNSVVFYVLIKIYFKSGYMFFTFLLLFLSYFFMNVITEYVMVLRNMLPCVAILVIFYVKAIKIKNHREAT